MADYREGDLFDDFAHRHEDSARSVPDLADPRPGVVALRQCGAVDEEDVVDDLTRFAKDVLKGKDVLKRVTSRRSVGGSRETAC